MQEWLEPFWHSNIVTGFGRIARAVLALPVSAMQSGLSRSGTDSCITLSARMARAILVRPVALLAC